jgi:L-arabinose isomerase
LVIPLHLLERADGVETAHPRSADHPADWLIPTRRAVLAVAPGDLHRGMQTVTNGELAEVIAFENERFDIDRKLTAADGRTTPGCRWRSSGSSPRARLDGWLAAGGPHHGVMNLGHHTADWRVFCDLAGIEFAQV